MSEPNQVCRLCLRKNVKMFNMARYSLKAKYFEVTGLKMTQTDLMLPQTACFICTAFLRKCSRFIQGCLRADQLLNSILLQVKELTPENINYEPLDVPYKLETHSVESFEYLDDWSDILHDTDDIKIEENDPPSSEVGSDREDVALSNYKTEIKSEVNVEENKKGKVKKKKIETVRKRKKKPISTVSPKRKPKKEPLVTKTEPDDLEEHFSNDELSLAETKPQKTVKKRGPAEKVASYAEEIRLTLAEQIAEFSKRKDSENFKTSPYQCQLCYIGFSHQRTFANHMAKHDASAGEYKCEVCHIRKRAKHSLTHHNNLLHAKRYKCKVCPYVARTSTQARLHHRWHNGFKFQCQFCGRTFSHQTSFLSHVRIVHPSEFVCDICGERFINQSGVNKHKRVIHDTTDEKVWEKAVGGPYCEECDVQFLNEEAYERHMITSSRHNQGNNCKICGEQYMIASELIAHERVCTVTKGKRVLHSRQTEREPSERVTCKECGVSLSSMNSYRAHHRLKHLGIRQYIPCTECNLRFPSMARLRYHRRTHTGERPFACPSCPKRFSMPDLLKLHSRTHSGERPYACTLCSKAFASKAGLNRHNMVHTGLKPYECEICMKKFSQCKALKHHVHTVHMKLPPPFVHSKRRKSSLEVGNDIVNDG